MNLIASYLVLAGGIIAAAGLLRVAVRLMRVDKIESKKSAARASTGWSAVRGRARTRDDWIPDARVKAGLIYNRGEKRLEISGRLSDDSLDRIFR